MTCGIYEIVNKVNGKRYVGSSVDVWRRSSGHKHRLRNGNASNKKLQNSWNKYGEDSFTFNVIEECPQDSLIEREQHHIDQGADLNIRKIADSNYGRIVPHSERLMRSEIMKRVHSENPDLAEATCVFFTNMWLDPEYNKRVSRAISISQTESWADSGKKATRLAKFHNYDYRKKMSKATEGKSNPRYDHKTYDFVNPNGSLVTCTKMELYTDFGLDKSHITKLCTGKAKSHRGWTLKKAPEGA